TAAPTKVTKVQAAGVEALKKKLAQAEAQAATMRDRANSARKRAGLSAKDANEAWELTQRAVNLEAVAEQTKKDIRAEEGEAYLERWRKEVEPFKLSPETGGEVRITSKELKGQQEELLEKLDKAIQDSSGSAKKKITIKVEGDGEFTIADTKEKLKAF